MYSLNIDELLMAKKTESYRMLVVVIFFEPIVLEGQHFFFSTEERSN